ncbi:MAG: hypothetical protein NXI23_26360 [Bacteroidetes bacterium]|nr:hypothetical protein [Bacteroidota bacterium]
MKFNSKYLIISCLPFHVKSSDYLNNFGIDYRDKQSIRRVTKKKIYSERDEIVEDELKNVYLVFVPESIFTHHYPDDFLRQLIEIKDIIYLILHNTDKKKQEKTSYFRNEYKEKLYPLVKEVGSKNGIIFKSFVKLSKAFKQQKIEKLNATLDKMLENFQYEEKIEGYLEFMDQLHSPAQFKKIANGNFQMLKHSESLKKILSKNDVSRLFIKLCEEAN